MTLCGTDARHFLQGQLSNDLRRLRPQQALLASCNSAQGRVQAVITLIEHLDRFLVLVPAALVIRLLGRLRRYVLRAQVTIDGNPGYALVPVTVEQAAALVGMPPQAPGECATQGPFGILRWWSTDERYLLFAPSDSLQGVGLRCALSDADLAWRRADIAAGLPQVRPETYELFVAQMLNLDLLGGISFDKGCYTGQEIIARVHYRGTTKRRLMRFAAECAAPAPGTHVLHASTHAGDVVDACPVTGPGAAPACEILAVISLDQAVHTLELDGVAHSTLAPLSVPYSTPA